MSSRSPRRSSESRFKGIGFDELVIKSEVLSDRCDQLEKVVADLYTELTKVTREQCPWSGWLYKLYKWLHQSFKQVPVWVEPQEGV